VASAHLALYVAMSELLLYRSLLLCWLGLAVGVFVLLLFVAAPYGRHSRRGWGPVIPARLGWVLMEAPSPIGMVVLFLLGSAAHRASVTSWVFLGIWLLHYVNRAFVFPFRMHSRGKAMPVAVVAMAIVFNLGNVYLNGRWIFSLGPVYSDAWLTGPRFWLGAALFVTGFVTNQHSDWVLLRLRRPGESGYKIPRGGAFRLVSCPNYLGEILECAGWAVATWCLGGLAFAVWTAANLVPRAVAHHRWYREQFPDYPPKRRAVLPYLV